MDYGWTGLGVVGIPIGEVFTWLGSCVFRLGGLCHFFYFSRSSVFLFFVYTYLSCILTLFHILFLKPCLYIHVFLHFMVVGT